jgi:glucose/arabinose dehydrogenase
VNIHLEMRAVRKAIRTFSKYGMLTSIGSHLQMQSPSFVKQLVYRYGEHMLKRSLPKSLRSTAVVGIVVFVVAVLWMTNVAFTGSDPTINRPINAAAALDPQKITFQEIAGGLNNPVLITNAGDGSGRIFVLERAGRIRIIKNGVLLTTPYLDIQASVKSTGGEQGLLALAFHPSYETNGKFYVVYTAPRDGDAEGSNLVLERFSVSSGDPDQATLTGRSVLLTIGHPTYSNHNGGTLAFGHDGFLYWSTGDGGGAGDPNNNAQNLNRRLGKILRIDVNSGAPYAIPPGNPFYSSTNVHIKKEIWAYGLRNPWRISFDRLTHNLYIADVGQGQREEIDFQPANSLGGQNYGWSVMEGSLCYNPSSDCDQSGKKLPVTEYDHSLGCSVTGGYVYRGTNFPSLYGYYFYGDYCSGRLFSLKKDVSWVSVPLVDTAYKISTFGEDEQREIYLADYATGKLYNIGYVEDTIPPVVNSVVRANPDPISAFYADFTVTFSEAVTGVNVSDFVLSTTGVTGASVAAVNGSGDTYTVTVRTGRGDGTIRLDVVDDDSIKDLAKNPLGGIGAGNGGYSAGETYTVVKPFMTFTSSDVEDGWIRESSEISNMGGTLDKTGTMLRLGDTALNRQYRAILSFDTSTLPVGAHITSVTLKFKFAGLVGTNPFATHGKLYADVRKGAFNSNDALQLADFNALASKNNVLKFINNPVNDWYSRSLGFITFKYVNRLGVTQFRLRFGMDDNNDFGADILQIYSGNALEADRPQLVIEYYVP